MYLCFRASYELYFSKAIIQKTAAMNLYVIAFVYFSTMLVKTRGAIKLSLIIQTSKRKSLDQEFGLETMNR